MNCYTIYLNKHTEHNSELLYIVVRLFPCICSCYSLLRTQRCCYYYHPNRRQAATDTGVRITASCSCFRLRLLSAAAEHITALFRVVHVCAADGLMRTAAADVRACHERARQSFCKAIPERGTTLMKPNNKNLNSHRFF